MQAQPTHLIMENEINFKESGMFMPDVYVIAWRMTESDKFT